jgi:hypothetical protein
LKTWLTAAALSASVISCGGAALAYDLRGNPPIMQVVTTYGPLQITGCTFNGIPNDAVQVSIMVRNRSAHKLVAFSARYRWYDPSDSKINDFTAAYSNLELDSGERGSYLQTGGDGGSPIRRLVCSVTQATFGDGTTWVAGGKYHGKLLPFSTSNPSP